SNRCSNLHARHYLEGTAYVQRPAATTSIAQCDPSCNPEVSGGNPLAPVPCPLVIGEDRWVGGREAWPQVEVVDRLRGRGVVTDAGPRVEHPHVRYRMDLRRRVNRIPVCREQVAAIARAPDRLVVLYASGAGQDRRRPELVPVGLRREADPAPDAG